MKKLVNISLVLLALSFAACKKNNTDTPPPAPIVVVPKVKTYTVSNGATLLNTVTFEYDNTGKKTKATYMDGSRYDYTYTANTVTEEYFTLAGVPQYKYIYTLNAGGLAESYSNPATPATIGYQFFNTEKHSILETTKTNGILTFQKYHLYDTDGNNSKDSVVQNSGTTIRTYEYYTDKVSTIDNINFGDFINGVYNKHCVKKQTSKSPLNVITTYDYSVPELDAQSRVIKQSYTSGANTINYTYSYY